jgi:hypothetical protein
MARRARQFDDVVMAGCAAFALASVAQWLAVFAPFALAPPLHTAEDLGRVLAIAGPAALVMGCLFTWRMDLAGFCGSLAGLVPADIFVWLRLRDAVNGLPGIEGFEPADFPMAWSWAVPLAYSCALGLLWYGVFALKAKAPVARRE